ncbi:hypothetical protein GCM10023336_67100 [Streptomyces similanensis]|uniref:Uncharacterized protein n=1 Tax=Streptomyces similanensis TaxID=1274988 RepID=A0ABP9LIF4_9ACTN
MSDAFALGTANAAAATSPAAMATTRVCLVMPRGAVRLILTFRASTKEVGGPRGVGAREAQPGAVARMPDVVCP